MIKDKTILIIDDSITILSILRRLLSGKFKETFSTRTGVRGVELIKEKHPDIVFLDINLPDVNGLSICKFIKQDPSFKDIKVIIYSAQNDPEIMQKAAKAGADDFMSKQEGLDQIPLLVDKIIEVLNS